MDRNIIIVLLCTLLIIPNTNAFQKVDLSNIDNITISYEMEGVNDFAPFSPLSSLLFIVMFDENLGFKYEADDIELVAGDIGFHSDTITVDLTSYTGEKYIGLSKIIPEDIDYTRDENGLYLFSDIISIKDQDDNDIVFNNTVLAFNVFPSNNPSANSPVYFENFDPVENFRHLEVVYGFDNIYSEYGETVKMKINGTFIEVNRYIKTGGTFQ